MLKLIAVLYFLLNIYVEFFGRYNIHANKTYWVKRWVFSYARYLVTILHELSHLFIGFLMGKGYVELDISKKEDTVGYYLPKYESPIKILWIKIGDVVTALAGPLLPPIIIWFYGRFLELGEYSNLTYFILGVLVVLIIFSNQRLYMILIGIGIYFLRGTLVGLLEWVYYFLYAWMILGLVDEVFVLKSYFEGSDAELIGEGLLGVKFKMVTYLINYTMVGYYVYMLYLILS